jgi:hypothetical protein
MKKLLLGTILLALLSFFPVATMAEVGVSIGVSIPLPPPIVFEAPPAVVVLPDTDFVYAVPGISVDLFFWNGFWWRPWEGRWYRSPYYDHGWVYYSSVPRFYYDVDPYWRGYYHNHSWHGYVWNYHPIPHSELQHNWKNWQGSRYWDTKKHWDVQGYTRKPQQQKQVLRQQRQQMYQQRPEVQQHQQFQKQQREEQQRQHQMQQHQPQREQHQPQGGQHQMGESHQQPQGHGKGEGHGK